MRTLFGAASGIGLLLIAAMPLRADLHFNKPTIAVGEIHGGAPLARRFTFVNEGPEKIEITGLHASCGCTKPRLQNLTYAPGEKGELLMEINTLSQSAGDHAWTVDVSYRAAGELRQQTIRTTGHIVAEVQVQPAALTVFTGHALEHTLAVTDIRAKPLKITDARASASYLKPHIGTPSRDDRDRWTCSVTLEIAADCPAGRHEEHLDLITSDPDYAVLRIPVVLVKHAKQRVTATPNPVVLNVLRDQPPPARILVIRDDEGQPVVIDRVDADDASLSCTWSQGPNTPGAVRVRLDMKVLGDSTLQSAIHIHVAKPVEMTLTVPVRALSP